MTTLASSLLEFILNLFRDEEQAAAFRADPRAALDDAGLTDVDPADVSAVMPMAGHGSSGLWGGDQCGPGGGHPAAWWGGYKHDRGDERHYGNDERHDGRDDHHYGRDEHRRDDYKDDRCDDDRDEHRPPIHDDCDDDKPWHHDDRGWHDNGGDKAAVLHEVRYVENNYTYNHTDVDVEIRDSILAGGDAQVIFGNGVIVDDSNINVALGGDVNDNDTTNNLDLEARDIVVGDDNIVGNELDVDIDDIVVGDGNANVEGNGNNTATGEHAQINDQDTTVTVGDVDVDLENVAIGDDAEVNSVEDSTNVALNGSTVEDQDGNIDVGSADNVNTGEGDIVDLDGATLVGHADNVETGDGSLVDVDVDDVTLAFAENQAVNSPGADVAGDDVDESHDFASDNFSENFSDNDLGLVPVFDGTGSETDAAAG